MKLSECNAGDLVAFELDGEMVVATVGRVLGTERRGSTKTFPATGVLVDRVYPETFAPMPWRDGLRYPLGVVAPDIECERIAEVSWLRRLRACRTGMTYEDGGEVDPLQSTRARGELL